ARVTSQVTRDSMWLSCLKLHVIAALPEPVGIRLPVPARAYAPARVAALAVGIAALYALGALLPFWFLTSPESGAAFFPAAGLTLAVLVLSPRRTWPLWLAVVAVAELAVDLTHGQSVGMAVGFTAANVVEPLAGATALIW